MATNFSGKHLLESLTKLNEKSKQVISEVRDALSPMLAAQGQTLETEESFASIITDINKLTPVEKHINNGSLKDMHYVESGIFANSIIPSNVITVGENRSVYVEEGLLYILDFDPATLKVKKKDIHRIRPLWDMCQDNKRVKLIKGNDIIWVVPSHGDCILGLKGDGIFKKSGSIRYMKLPIEQDLIIVDFKEFDNDIAFISSEYRYYRLDNVYDTDGWTADNWNSWNMGRCFATCICDGNLDYVGTKYGEIWKFDRSTGSFVYVMDTKNEVSYEDHYRNMIANRDQYLPILYIVKNDIQWTILEKPNKLHFILELDADELGACLTSVELPGNVSMADIAVNRKSYYDRSIIYGYDDDLNAVAYSYRTEFEDIDVIELGSNDLVPQWISVGISDSGAVLLELYEHSISAAKYYTEEDILANGYRDFRYTSMAMRYATYEDYNFIFGPEFNPLFIPSLIKSEKGKTVVIDRGSTSASFNIAFTADQSNWNLINLDPELAINVQDMDSGNGIFVLVGLKNSCVLISKNAYSWDRIELSDSNLDLISVTYNRYRNRFYAINQEGTRLVEIDPELMRSHIYELSGTTSSVYQTSVKNICSFAHNVIINIESNGSTTSYQTASTELDVDIMVNGLKKITFALFDPNDPYATARSSLINTFEVADMIYSIHQLNIPWNNDAVTEYDKSLLTGIVICHPKSDRELREQSIGINSLRYTAFPYDPSTLIEGMEYLNHVVLIQQQEKYFIPMNQTSAPICYFDDNAGKFFVVQVNAKCGSIGDGYLHLIQSHTSNFVRIAYIMSSDQSYSPVVTNVDLVQYKKSNRVSEYELENDFDNVDCNGNIEAYNALYSDLKTNYPGSIIRSEKFIRVGKGSVGYVSEDGVHWSEGFTMPSAGWWRDICYGTNIHGEKIYVAINYSNATMSELWYSTNLINWQKAVIPDLKYGWYSVECTDGLFVAVAHYTANSKYVITSTDGKTWNSLMLDHVVDMICTPVSDIMVYSSITNTNRDVRYVITRDLQTYPITIRNDTGSVNASVVNEVSMFVPIHMDSDLYIYRVILAMDDMGNAYSSLGSDGAGLNTGKITKIASLSDKPRLAYGDSRLRFAVLYNLNANYIYIVSIDDTDESAFLFTKVDIPCGFPDMIGHPFCIHDDKLFVGTANPVIIDLRNTIPDRIDGSFMVENSKKHYQTLPFTPDHVFLLGADSDSNHDKVFIGEIHREDVVGASGNGHHSSTIFNNTEQSIRCRSDIDDTIVERGFIYTNRSNTDRLINFIAIKEDHYS